MTYKFNHIKFESILWYITCIKEPAQFKGMATLEKDPRFLKANWIADLKIVPNEYWSN